MELQLLNPEKYLIEFQDSVLFPEGIYIRARDVHNHGISPELNCITPPRNFCAMIQRAGSQDAIVVSVVQIIGMLWIFVY